MRRLYGKGLTTSLGGNISMRLADGTIAVTPSATDKGTMKWRQVCLISPDGTNLTPELKPSMETGMHLSVYSRNNEIGALIHAHPVCASAFTAMKSKIDTTLTAEAAAFLGTPAIVPYALMGTTDLADAVSGSIVRSEILLLENHGVLTAGKTLLQAFDRIEVLENAARMTFITELMRSKKPLGKTRISEIEKLFR